MKIVDLNMYKWKEFKFTDVFDIKKGYYNKKPPIDKSGAIPFLGATKNNNGVTNYYTKETILKYDKVGGISDKDADQRIFPGNAIAITNNGSVGHAYYQDAMFTCSHDITPVYLKNKKLNRNIAMFLIPLIIQTGKSFSYGQKWRPQRMVHSKILLPINNQNEIDYALMETYTTAIEENKKLILSKYLQTKIIKAINVDVNLEDKIWAPFELQEVVEINSGKRLVKSEQVPGNIPFIGASDNNNGITNFVDNVNDSLDSNVLGVNYNGSVGYSFYHPYKAIFSDDVKRLKFKEEIKNNKYTLLFLKVLITQQQKIFAYGYKFNTTRMNLNYSYYPKL